MAVKWRLNLRKGFVCSSAILQNLWPLFNGVLGVSSIETLHVRIKLAFTGWVAILLSFGETSWNVSALKMETEMGGVKEMGCREIYFGNVVWILSTQNRFHVQFRVISAEHTVFQI
jgi:hypothetical protein